MYKFLKYSKFSLYRPAFQRFSSIHSVDFQNFYPIIKDQKNSENLEFKLLMERKSFEGKKMLFDMSKTATLQDLFNKITEYFEFKSLQAYSLDKVELSNMTLLSNFENSNFYLLGDKEHLFKIIDVSNDNSKKNDEIEKYCDELDISYLQKKIITNYLNRFDKLNELKFGVKIFDNDNEKNNKLIDKEALMSNLIEALPTNRSSPIVDEEALFQNYLQLKNQVENLRSRKEQLEQIAHKSAKRKMVIGLLALFGQFGFVGYGTYVVYSWDIIEPMVYFIGLGASILLGVQYFKLNEQYNNTSFFEYLKKKDLEKICKKVNFKLSTLEENEKALENMDKFIKSNILLNL